jgi:carboxylesterase
MRHARVDRNGRSDGGGPGASPIDAEPFRFESGPDGVLLIHGFCGTPFAMRGLGASLAERGFTVHGPRLAGHDEGSADLGGTTWPDWYAGVERALDELRARCRRVAVCGLSLGGLLTLELARRRPGDVSAIATLSAPFFLPSFTTMTIRAAQRWRGLRQLVIPRLIGSDIRDPEMRRRNPALPMPVRALGSLVEFIDHVRLGARHVDRPALVAHGRRDHTAPFAASAAIARALAGPVETLVLERSFHVITLDVERELLQRSISDFLARRLRA